VPSRWERQQMIQSLLREYREVDRRIRYGEFSTQEELNWLSGQRELLQQQIAELQRNR